MSSEIVEPLLEVKFFTFFYLIRYFGPKVNISPKKLFWCTSLFMSVFIYFYSVDFQYNLSYLGNSVQVYSHMSKLINCLIIYLIEDLLFDPYIDKIMVVHHVEAIVGLSIGQLGNFTGGLNNTVRNEISTMWLALYYLTKDLGNLYIKSSSNLFFLVFLFSYTQNRIIPLTKMLWISFYNFNYFYSGTHNVFFIIITLNIIHTFIQYYWFYNILRIIHKKFFLNVN